MKVAFFTNSSGKDLEKKVNEFLSTCIEIVDIKFAACKESFDVMVIYKD